MAFIDLKPGSPNVPTAVQAEEMRQSLDAEKKLGSAILTAAGSPYTLTVEYAKGVFLWIDASAGDVYINLPAVDPYEYIIRWKRVDSSTNDVTVDPNGAEQIEGGSTFAPPAGSSGEIRAVSTTWAVTAFSVDNPVSYVD